MTNVNALISQRLKKGDPSSKMSAMAQQSASGNRSSFSGIFHLSELTDKEKEQLKLLLHSYSQKEVSFKADLDLLILITQEIKAINHQAALLHGERIKKAQALLKNYKDGAFSAWLKAAYGNRQTPYNLLQYFEFWESTPPALKETLELMPRQAIYTLASRNIPFPEKQKIVKEYKGETKQELLDKIRLLFPLKEKDLRKQNISYKVLLNLEYSLELLSTEDLSLSTLEKNNLLSVLKNLQNHIENMRSF